MIQKRECCEMQLKQALYICACIFILMYDVLQPLLPWKISSELATLEKIICFSCLGLIIASIPNASRKKSLFCLALFWVWMIVIRLAIQHLTEAMTIEIVRVGLICTVFYLTSALDANGKRHLVDAFCALFFPILTVWAIMGLLVYTNVIPEVQIGEKRIYAVLEINRKLAYIMRYLVFFELNKNVSATWFMTALWLSIGHFFRTRRKWVRVLLVLFGGLMYVTLSLQRCRFVNVACSVGAGMLAILLIKDHMKNPKTAIRRMAAVLAALVVAVGCYKGFGLCSGVAGKFAALKASVADQPVERPALQPEENEPSKLDAAPEAEIVSELKAEPVTEPETEPVTEPETEPKPISESWTGDSRSFFKQLANMSDRTDIWASCLRVVFRRKKFMLLGQPVEEIPMNMVYYGDADSAMGHAHNMFIQVLAQTGIIGFGLMVAFTYMQVRAAIRLFFSREQPLSRKIYGILLTCLLLEGVGESLLLLQFAPLALMFTAGMLADQEEPTDFRKIFRFRRKKA